MSASWRNQKCARILAEIARKRNGKKWRRMANPDLAWRCRPWLMPGVNPVNRTCHDAASERSALHRANRHPDETALELALERIVDAMVTPRDHYETTPAKK